MIPASVGMVGKDPSLSGGACAEGPRSSPKTPAKGLQVGYEGKDWLGEILPSELVAVASPADSAVA